MGGVETADGDGRHGDTVMTHVRDLGDVGQGDIGVDGDAGTVTIKRP